jgi:hypothetical protein
LEWFQQLPEIVLQYFECDEKAKASSLSRHVLWNIFLEICKTATEKVAIYAVLDGLDKCDVDSRSWLAQKFTEVFRPEGGKQQRLVLKLLILSRDDVHSRRWLAQNSTLDLDTQRQHETNRDVKIFTFSKINEIQHIEGWNNELRRRFEWVFLAQADSTFIWVGYAMEADYRHPNSGSITGPEETTERSKCTIPPHVMPCS